MTEETLCFYRDLSETPLSNLLCKAMWSTHVEDLRKVAGWLCFADFGYLFWHLHWDVHTQCMSRGLFQLLIKATQNTLARQIKYSLIQAALHRLCIYVLVQIMFLWRFHTNFYRNFIEIEISNFSPNRNPFRRLYCISKHIWCIWCFFVWL